MPANRIVLYFDGGCKGNPGPMNKGTRIEVWDHEKSLDMLSFCGPVTAEEIGTNNRAEYYAFLDGLRQVREALERHGMAEDGQINILGDSRLVVEQVLGNWQISKPQLADLAHKARNEFSQLKKSYPKQLSLMWIKREKNLADCSHLGAGGA